MDSSNRKEKQQHDETADGKYSFDYEESYMKDYLSPTDGEEQEDVKEHLEDTRAPDVRSFSHQQLSVLDFLRNFLLQRGMTETLECFEAEWTELVQRGEVDAKRVDPVPEVYTENQRLEGELRNAWREMEAFGRAASGAAEAGQTVRRARDARRLQHRQVVQEKNRLVGEIRRLKLRCDNYKPEVKRLCEKYQAVSKQVVQVDPHPRASEQ